jgi:hypothetical protein
MTKSGRPAMKWVYINDEPASAMNTGTPISSTAMNRNAMMIIERPCP